MRPTRSRTRASTGRRQSSYGIELAAAVGVLEAQAVDREHGAAAHADGRLRLGLGDCAAANSRPPSPNAEGPPVKPQHAVNAMTGRQRG